MQEHSEDIHSRPLPRCPQCGETLRAGNLVCPACGHSIRDEEITGPGPEAPDRKSS